MLNLLMKTITCEIIKNRDFPYCQSEQLSLIFLTARDVQERSLVLGYDANSNMI